MISVVVSDAMIQALELSGRYSKGNARVRKTARLSLPPGVVEQDVIVDVPLFTEKLRQVMRGMSSSQVVISFLGVASTPEIITVPYDRDPGRQRAIVCEALRLPEEYIVDYRMIARHEEDSGTWARLCVYAARREIVWCVHRVLRSLRKKPAAFRAVQDSIYSVAQQMTKQRVAIFLYISERKILTHLYRPQPGNVLTRISDIREQYRGTLEYYEVPDQAGHISPGDIYAMAADQLFRLFQYQRAQQPHLPVEAVYVYGSMATSACLPELQRGLDAPLLLIHMSDCSIERGAILSDYMYALGALMAEQGVDLFRDCARKAREGKKRAGLRASILGLCMALILGGYAVLCTQMWFATAHVQHEIAWLQQPGQDGLAPGAGWEAERRFSQDMRRLEADLHAQALTRAAYHWARAQRGYGAHLRDIARGDGTVSLTFVADGDTAPRRVVENLKASGTFRRVWYEGFSRVDGVYQFRVLCDL